jgi:predicted ATPase
VKGLPDLIRERTGGNPFFIEEVVQALVEDGSLVGARGAYRLVKPMERVAVPPTVQAVLAARIDRVESREKHLLSDGGRHRKGICRASTEARGGTV